ncbi:hypothetical protein [Streptomyces sp. NBC_00986]|uniref:hypothetical protein n=1 Tax=Streptomyces sp. NBC_00986 TaxID=2903702 RepID=UPI003864D09B|nr:hypothetical protein OG504_51570 [Streptomyces sp. NBC_00986]
MNLSSDNFVEELGKQGLDAQGVLPSGAEMGPAQPVVTIQGDGRQVTMARAGLEQLMLELIDLQSWVRILCGVGVTGDISTLVALI